MRQIILSLVLLTFFQVGHSQNVGGGLSAGFNTSQIDGDGFGGFYKVGASLGGYVYYDIFNNLRFQVDLLYDQVGSSWRNNEINYRVNYFSVPVLLNLNIPIQIGASEFEIGFHGGPSFGILLGAEDVLNEQDFTDELNSLEVRMVGGGSFNFTERFAFLLRYGYSISNLAAGSPSSALFPENVGPFNNVVTFSFRYELFTR
ncbi:MAG: outer membrane beta-barrel protein [Bacteroidota bacterium]